MDSRSRSVRFVPLALFAIVFIAGLGPFFGYLRAGIAFVIAAAILSLGIGYFRSAGRSEPEVQPNEDVEESDMRYVCSVCGLELKILVATNDRPPTHCREKMDLVGRPALRPLD